LITFVTAAFGILVAVLLLYLMRKDHLNVSLGVGWSVAVVLSAMLGFAPGIFDFIATSMGVTYAPILGVSIAIAALVTKALVSDLQLTKLKVQQQRLTQKMALLEADLRELTDKPKVDD
jgi:hypothetical protein